MVDPRWHSRTDTGRGFFDVAAAGRAGMLLALDFDGTLAGLVPDPEDSRLHPGSAAALARLGGLVGRIAIITGRGVDVVRRLGELDGRPGLENLVVLGQYGVETYDAATGRTTTHPVGGDVGAARQDLRGLLEELAAGGEDVAGVHIEDKGLAVAVHTRRATDPAGAFERLTPAVSEVGRRHGLHVEPGRMVIELRASTRTKGDALRELVRDAGSRVVAMVGDDLGDLPAFEALRELRAVGIECCAVVSSSDEQPALVRVADVVCDGPDGVADWLGALAEHLETHA